MWKKMAWVVWQDVVLEIGQLWMREAWTWILKFQNFGSKVVTGALPPTLPLSRFEIQSEIFVNILEHSGARRNAYKPGSPHVFLSILYRLRESQWILLGTKIRNGKTKNPPRRKVKRSCWKRVRWSVFPLSNAVFVKNTVTGGGDGNTSPGRFSRFVI